MIGLRELFFQLVLQGRETVSEGRVVFLDRLGADIATGGQHMTMTADFRKARRLAEARHVSVTLTKPPSMVGFGNPAPSRFSNRRSPKGEILTVGYNWTNLRLRGKGSARPSPRVCTEP